MTTLILIIAAPLIIGLPALAVSALMRAIQRETRQAQRDFWSE